MATVHMPPPHRPSMDRTSSFEQARPRSTPPFATQQRSSSPLVRQPQNTTPPQQYQQQQQQQTHQPYPYNPYPTSQSHSRSSSSTSAHSPYQQPFASNYFPNQLQYAIPHSQSWSNTAMPASAFYPAAQMQPYPGQPVFHQGFQQSQADFAAWANAYHHMMAASMGSNGDQSGQYDGHTGVAGMAPPQPDFAAGHRRTNSDPSRTQKPQQSQGYGNQFEALPSSKPGPPQQRTSSNTPPQNTTSKLQASSQPFHPYKRNQPTRRSSNEAIQPAKAGSTMPRSTSTPAFPNTSSHKSPSSSISSHPSTNAPEMHHRQPSQESSASVPVQRPPIAPRKDSVQTPDKNRSSSPVTTKATATTSTIRAVQPSTAQSVPLQSGPIANNATNTPQPPSGVRPSPLSQTASTTASPEPEKVKNGLKSRLKKALDKEASMTRKASAPPTMSHSGSMSTFKSPSSESDHSVTQPMTPPQAQSNDFRAPLPSFVSHPSAMGSDVSLANTERTATVAGSEMGDLGPEKGKRKGLFKMRNMSTDNISLSSTVSSASMMIRKMGSLGKLARRNSLMGISKIFKDKPKDEDAALPEKEAKMKKSKKKKSKGGKGEAAPTSVSHATVEQDRNDASLGYGGDEDRALIGLSPAAKLARQHTLKTKAEIAQKEAARLSQISQTSSTGTGEPTWDNNTTTRSSSELPPISTVMEEDIDPITELNNGGQFGQRQGGGISNVVRVTPRQSPTLVHAVAVSQDEYDSEDDSSEGETVEDVTTQLARSRLSDGAADRAFREAWGNAWIDKNAVPKKGILKNVVSAEDLESKAQRQRSASTADKTLPPTRGPLSSPPADPDKMDGLDNAHAELLVNSEPGPAQFTTSPEATPPLGSPNISTPGSDSTSHMISNSPHASFAAALTASFDQPIPTPELHFPYGNPNMNTSAPALSLVGTSKPLPPRALTAPAPERKKILWAPECAVYSTYGSETYDRRSEVATCNRLTPELAMAIKQELNAFKLEMPVHPTSRVYTHYFA